jgi:hypothetical protein
LNLVTNQEEGPVERRLRTPNAAAVAGIIFAVLYGTSLVLIRLSVPSDLSDRGIWVQDQAGAISLAMNLLPFAGIAFLWFMGVVRDHMGAHEDQFFATVFLGSGLLFLAMIFAAAAVAIATLASLAAGANALVESSLYLFERHLIYQFGSVFALRMAGVFMISLGTIWLRTRIVERWFVILTYVLALSLLLLVNVTLWTQLAFPGWVLAASVYFLIRRKVGSSH